MTQSLFYTIQLIISWHTKKNVDHFCVVVTALSALTSMYPSIDEYRLWKFRFFILFTCNEKKKNKGHINDHWTYIHIGSIFRENETYNGLCQCSKQVSVIKSHTHTQNKSLYLKYHLSRKSKHLKRWFCVMITMAMIKICCCSVAIIMVVIVSRVPIHDFPNMKFMFIYARNDKHMAIDKTAQHTKGL